MGIDNDMRATTSAAARRPDGSGDEPRETGEKPEGKADRSAGELTRSNARLTQEIEDRRRAEGSLQGAYLEIKRLKDRLQAENDYLQQEIAREYNFGEIVGESRSMSQLLLRVEQVAAMNATVLLIGETGAGKGVAARAIHNGSSRRDHPLITVNLAELPANLIESELFGWERGEATGADVRQIGRLELADDGTVFLEEIGALPPELQGKLLRVIRDGEFERLGSSRTVKIDVRVIASHHGNLQQEVLNGGFREDLFYRLNVFTIAIPPLRRRKEDIPSLVGHFLAKYNARLGKTIETVSQETLDALAAYHWPGNVRELESVMERAVIVSRGAALQLPDRFGARPGDGDTAAPESVKDPVESEHDRILEVLDKTGWRIEGSRGAAGFLGLNPSTLRARMRKHGILRR